MIKWPLKLRLPFRPTEAVVEENALIVSKTRLYVILFTIVFAYFILAVRLFEVSISSREDLLIGTRSSGTDFFVQRADIVDRNGMVLATNLATASLYANPQKILNAKAAAEKLCTTFSELNCFDTYKKLQDPSKTFQWIIRHLTPKQQQLAHDLAIPGLEFIREEKRVYPHGSLFAHLLGFVDLDSTGMAGLERSFNSRLIQENTKPLVSSVDTRIQQILREEIAAQVKLHDALGGSGVVMDAHTGEILALVSLPDFDPNYPGRAEERSRFNQVTLGAYEMGSTLKILTVAMGLEGGYIKVNDAFNTNAQIMIGSHKVSDYRGKGGMLSVPEILMYSSNIGVAQIALKAGATKQRDFLQKFGLLNDPVIEIPEKTRPLFPSLKNWNNSNMIAISFGHAIAITPLQSAASLAATINGGKLVKTTLLKQDDPQSVEYEKVLSDETSQTMRKLLRLVAVGGSGKKANAEGYLVGGKTGSAEKIINGRYSKTANLASFLGAFPMNDPRYVILIMIDEAKRNEINHGFTTGGMIAAPVAGNVIARIAPVLNIEPVESDDESIHQALELDFTPRYLVKASKP